MAPPVKSIADVQYLFQERKSQTSTIILMGTDQQLQTNWEICLLMSVTMSHSSPG